MNCPKCGYGYSSVVDCRMIGGAKRRRRECAGCGHLFTAYEILAEDYNKMTIACRHLLKAAEILEVNNENKNH